MSRHYSSSSLQVAPRFLLRASRLFREWTEWIPSRCTRWERRISRHCPRVTPGKWQRYSLLYTSKGLTKFLTIFYLFYIALTHLTSPSIPSRNSCKKDSCLPSRRLQALEWPERFPRNKWRVKTHRGRKSCATDKIARKKLKFNGRKQKHGNQSCSQCSDVASQVREESAWCKVMENG